MWVVCVMCMVCDVSVVNVVHMVCMMCVVCVWSVEWVALVYEGSVDSGVFWVHCFFVCCCFTS